MLKLDVAVGCDTVFKRLPHVGNLKVKVCPKLTLHRGLIQAVNSVEDFKDLRVKIFFLESIVIRKLVIANDSAVRVRELFLGQLAVQVSLSQF